MTDVEHSDYEEIERLREEGCVIQSEVQNVAIFAKCDGDIVVKEIVHAFPAPCYTTIIIGRNNVRAAVEAMLRAADLDADPVEERTPKDRTAADRQCRHREEQKRERDQRDEERDSPVMEEMQFSLVAAE